MSSDEKPTRAGRYLRSPDGTLRLLSLEEEMARDKRTGFSEAVELMLGEDRYSAAAVFERLKQAIGTGPKDADLAWWMGVSPQNIWNRKSRNTVPYREAVYVSVTANVSLQYLLTGDGDIWDGPRPGP